ncbi:MAG: glycine zipper family protein [Methylococcaceae bacterium]
MNKFFKAITISSSLLFSACATQSNWTPTVDPYGDQNAHRINQDYDECRQLALQASGGTAKEATTGAVVGGLIGAISGVALGAISGNPGAGAAYGAAIGGFGGGVKQGFSSEDRYKRAYSNCMRHRGHYTID